jgi:prepilin-type N-terminal cleavage/methylation domain-containing protein
VNQNRYGVVMPHTVLKNKKGLTLVEVMIASVIVLILFLALMQSVLLSVSMNLKNQLRDEAVNIAEERMRELRSESFDPIPPATTNALTDTAGPVLDTDADHPLGVVTRSFRDFTRDFTRRRTIADLGTDVKSITVSVSYMDVKDNRCSVTTATACSQDSDCPGGETCGSTQTISSILRDN